jgi:hypothetical protein
VAATLAAITGAGATAVASLSRKVTTTRTSPKVISSPELRRALVTFSL